jgi:hypothetical protein
VTQRFPGMLPLLGVAVAAWFLGMGMDHSHRQARMEASTSVAIQHEDGKVTTLRTLDDVAEFTKELSIATAQGFQYVRHRTSKLEAQHASLRADHAGVSDRVLELENAFKIGCMIFITLALYLMVLQNQRLASLSQSLSVAQKLVGSAAAVFILGLTLFPIQDKYMLILGGAMCGCAATWLCSYHAANIVNRFAQHRNGIVT